MLIPHAPCPYPNPGAVSFLQSDLAQIGDMEEVVESSKPSLGGPSSSFRLRSPSLNCLRLRRIFDVFDANGDGMISLEELRRALEQLGLEADQSDLESTVLRYVRPGNTGLGFEDFETLHQSLGHALFGSDDGDLSDPDAQEEADLAEAFKVFDEDGDGFISATELQVVLDKLGLPEAQEMDRVHQMIISVDQNQDGRVDFSEFKNMMQNVTIRATAA